MSQEKITPVRRFRAQIRGLERVFSRMLEDQTGCCDVTLPQCHALLELEGVGCVNLNGLAAQLGLDKSTLSRTVDGLVGMGLVNRSTDPENRRQQIICLSPAGIERVQHIHSVCDIQYQAVLDRIPPQEIPGILQALSLVQEACAAQAADAPSPAASSCCKNKEI